VALWGGDPNDAHSVRSTEDGIYMFLQQQQGHQNPLTATPLGVTQPDGWNCCPAILHKTLDDRFAINQWPTAEPSQSHSLSQSHGDPNTRASNGQEAIIARHPNDQSGNNIAQAMAAVRRAIAHGSDPSEDELVQFLEYENSSYICLCCGKIFGRRHRALDHLRGHFGLRAYPCRGGCGKSTW